MTKKCFNKALGLINFEGVHLASLNDIFLFCFVFFGGGRVSGNTLFIFTRYHYSISILSHKYMFCFSFEDLKLGLNNMRLSARTRSEGPIAFVKTNIAAILDCLESLNSKKLTNIHVVT